MQNLIGGELQSRCANEGSPASLPLGNRPHLIDGNERRSTTSSYPEETKFVDGKELLI